jgi:hypothetical protein
MYYFLAPANDAEEARGLVVTWLGEYQGREFYEDFYIEGSPVPLCDVIGEVKAAKERLEYRIMPSLQDELDALRYTSDRRYEGFIHCQYGALLQETLCSRMTIYNFDYTDYSIPEDTDGWWVVRVGLD